MQPAYWLSLEALLNVDLVETPHPCFVLRETFSGRHERVQGRLGKVCWYVGIDLPPSDVL